MSDIIQNRYDSVDGRTVIADIIFVISVDDILTHLYTNHIDPKCYLEPKKPYQLNSGVYIISHTPTFGIHASCSSGEHIKVPVGSNIRWRATTISDNFNYTVILYHFDKLHSSGNKIISQASQIWSHTPSRIIPALQSGVNACENAPKIDLIETKDHFFQAVALARGRERYTWAFGVYDGEEPQGFFKYDPYIHVTPSNSN
ncbi:AidA/PixA family protein [Photorhabdus australis]|uniref:AidA/PixA family protein n=1 Tax=Photorhabdus australis TaxID=286156 RepID=UPI00056C6B22|nr:AidA/PixA family protein [Photorhabdus australis]